MKRNILSGKGIVVIWNVCIFDVATGLVEIANVVDVVYPGLIKAFDKVSHDSLTARLVKCGLDNTTVSIISPL